MARVYATEQQFVEWTGDSAASASTALLTRASLVVDGALVGAVYDVNPTTLMPTKTDVIEALRDAVCAQVQWWDEIGDTTGAGAANQFQSASIGSAAYTKGYTPAGSNAGPQTTLAPIAFLTLSVAGLLTSQVWVCG